MAEAINFVFDGKLASQHKMDFYESARFQYSASRLLVKLDNFRRTGKFPKKITSGNRHDIQIREFKRGSFGIELLIPVFQAAGPAIFDVSISAMLSYVIDRVFKSADDEVVLKALQTQNRLIDAYENSISGRDDTIAKTIELLRTERENDRQISEENRTLYERLIAETERRALLQGERDALSRMSRDQAAELITMAAPLLKEMNVPLRRSASEVTIRANVNGARSTLLHADKEMADEVDIAIVDNKIVTIDIDVIQFNKENGWGKFRNTEWEGIASFSVPAHLLTELRDQLVDAMNHDLISVDCQFVRSPSMVPLRIIVIEMNEILE